ncbi:sensor histidine kinase [Pedococcus bigeumensis]|uniref:sensor histidine kinase n=1 Tax=Pedococcus bigeumensis TaxID=433644 RepID=UPI0031DDDC6D
MTRRNVAFDITVAMVVGVLGQLEAWWGFTSTHRQGPLWAQALLYAVTAVLLAGRRVNPLACQAAILVASTVEFAMVGAPEGNGVMLPMLIATYTVGRWLPSRRTWWGLVVAAAFWASWSSLDPAGEHATLRERLLTLVWLSPTVIALLVGAVVRLTALNTEQRRANRRALASQAVAEERNRIARELHDVIGHSVSVMTVQASAVRRRLTPEQAAERQALETVEAVGREALAEMRRMVGVLRQAGDETQLEPPPGLDQLDRLADKFRTAGLPVDLQVNGPVQALAPGLDLTAYRLVQEGLTNTLRHARSPRSAAVVIDYGAERIQLAVRDDGQPTTGATHSPEAGSGLLGMRERVAVYGGSLVARVRPEGGFELVATLPLESA